MGQSYGAATYGLAKALIAEGGNLATISDVNKVAQDLLNEAIIRAAADANFGETAETIKSKLGISVLSGSNTGDETLATIKAKLGITTLSGSNTGDQVIPTSLPASDVYTWAKQPSKPTYSAAEVGAQAAGTGLSSDIGYSNVGSLCLATYGGNGAVSGSTIAGSNLFPCGDCSNTTGSDGSYGFMKSPTPLSGTWRCLGYGIHPAYGGSETMTLWQRIA